MCIHIKFFIFIYFTVPQTVPDLIVTALSPISLLVEWSAINVHLASGAVTQYQVMWKRSQSESNYVQVLNKEARQYTITGNEIYELYFTFIPNKFQSPFPHNCSIPYILSLRSFSNFFEHSLIVRFMQIASIFFCTYFILLFLGLFRLYK